MMKGGDNMTKKVGIFENTEMFKVLAEDIGGPITDEQVEEVYNEMLESETAYNEIILTFAKLIMATAKREEYEFSAEGILTYLDSTNQKNENDEESLTQLFKQIEDFKDIYQEKPYLQFLEHQQQMIADVLVSRDIQDIIADGEEELDNFISETETTLQSLYKEMIKESKKEVKTK